MEKTSGEDIILRMAKEPFIIDFLTGQVNVLRERVIEENPNHQTLGEFILVSNRLMTTLRLQGASILGFSASSDLRFLGTIPIMTSVHQDLPPTMVFTLDNQFIVKYTM